MSGFPLISMILSWTSILPSRAIRPPGSTPSTSSPWSCPVTSVLGITWMPSGPRSLLRTTRMLQSHTKKLLWVPYFRVPVCEYHVISAKLTIYIQSVLQILRRESRRRELSSTPCTSRREPTCWRPRHARGPWSAWGTRLTLPGAPAACPRSRPPLGPPRPPTAPSPGCRTGPARKQSHHQTEILKDDAYQSSIGYQEANRKM